MPDGRPTRRIDRSSSVMTWSGCVGISFSQGRGKPQPQPGPGRPRRQGQLDLEEVEENVRVPAGQPGPAGHGVLQLGEQRAHRLRSAGDQECGGLAITPTLPHDGHELLGQVGRVLTPAGAVQGLAQRGDQVRHQRSDCVVGNAQPQSGNDRPSGQPDVARVQAAHDAAPMARDDGNLHGHPPAEPVSVAQLVQQGVEFGRPRKLPGRPGEQSLTLREGQRVKLSKQYPR